MSAHPNWADVLGKEPAFVILRKENRLQFILRPTGKQLRGRGKRNWDVVTAGPAAGDGESGVPDDARGALLDAVAELAADRPVVIEEPKRKKRKKAAR